MSVIRVHKNKNFTVMSNVHLRDMDLSLKAKGLLSVMLSLPDNWNYSIAGLCSICKENETAIKSTIKELKERRYVIVDKKYPNQTESKKYEYVYNIFEEPQPENQEVEKQGVENLPLDNLHIESNPLNKITDISSTDKLNTDGTNTKGSKTDNKYALEDVKRPSSKGDMYASVPEEQEADAPKKQSRYIPKDYTEEQLIEHIRPTIEDNLKTVQEDCGMEYNPKRADDIVEIVTDFFEQYREKTGHRHKILPDATLINIMYRYFNPPECLWNSNDPSTYSAMAEEYLDTNFNARGGYDGEVTLSISHFMSDKIRENCYQRIK